MIIESQGGKEASVNRVDLEQALKNIKPSGIREISVSLPKVRWKDIGGLHEVKVALNRHFVVLDLTRIYRKSSSKLSRGHMSTENLINDLVSDLLAAFFSMDHRAPAKPCFVLLSLESATPTLLHFQSLISYSQR